LAATDDDVGAVIDGRLIKAGPARAFESGQAASVPLLIGSNSGEDNLMGDTPPGEVLKDYTADQLAALRKAYGEPAASDDTTLAHAIYRDQFMGAPARWIAARQSAGAPTYLYYFDYVPQIIRTRMPKANHGVEMLFSFAAMTRAPRPIHIVTDADGAEMKLVHGCWAAFVKTGAPNCAGWPAYSPSSDQLLDFGDQATVRTGFNKAAYDILDGIEQKQLAGSR
jgi:para-nitrobenzyl esterase